MDINIGNQNGKPQSTKEALTKEALKDAVIGGAILGVMFGTMALVYHGITKIIR